MPDQVSFENADGLIQVIHYIRDPVLDEDPIAQAIIQRTSAVYMADDMGFGKIGRGGIFNNPDLHIQIGSWSDIAATFPALYLKPQDGDLIVAALKITSDSGSKDWMALANDIVPFLSEYLGTSRKERPIIPWPNASSRGLSCTAFRCFEEQLIAYVDRHAYTTSKALLEMYQTMGHALSGPNQIWTEHVPVLSTALNRFTSEETAKLCELLEELEQRLYESPVVRAGLYKDLIAWHLFVLVRGQGETVGGESAKMQKLFSSLPELTIAVKITWSQQRESNGFERPDDVEVPGAEIIESAWIAMFLRAMCWQRLHIVAQLGTGSLPVEFEESKFPVYIG